MKKLSALILSLALSAALLAGCGASASSAASSEAVSSEVVSEAVSEAAISTAEAADSAEAIQFTFTVTGADGESTVLTLDAAEGGPAGPDEGPVCHCRPLTGNYRRPCPHQSAGGAADSFPRGGSRSFPKVSLSHEREAFLFTTYGRNCNFMVYYIG